MRAASELQLLVRAYMTPEMYPDIDTSSAFLASRAVLSVEPRQSIVRRRTLRLVVKCLQVDMNKQSGVKSCSSSMVSPSLVMQLSSLGARKLILSTLVLTTRMTL